MGLEGGEGGAGHEGFKGGVSCFVDFGGASEMFVETRHKASDVIEDSQCDLCRKERRCYPAC